MSAPVGISVSREDLPAHVCEQLDAFEQGQRSGQVESEGSGMLRRFSLDATSLHLPELGERDTASSGGMAFFIVLAIFTGLYGLGGLTNGGWAQWLLPVCLVSIVAAVALGKRWGKEKDATRAGGVERDGIYLLPAGVVVRSHERYELYPLHAIRSFGLGAYKRGIRWVVMRYEAGGIRKIKNIGNSRELDDELCALTQGWLESVRAT